MSLAGHEGAGSTPGAYILLFSLPEDMTIEVGKLGIYHFPAGRYAYVGSALRGLEARAGRHIKGATNKHWHIDFVLEHAVGRMALLFPSDTDIECYLAQELSTAEGITTPVEGFGSSDCRCPSHLFFLDGMGREAVRRLAKAYRASSLR